MWGRLRLHDLVVIDEIPKRVRIKVPRGDAQSSPAQSRPEGTAGLVGAAGLVSVCSTNTPLSLGDYVTFTKTNKNRGDPLFFLAISQRFLSVISGPILSHSNELE